VEISPAEEVEVIELLVVADDITGALDTGVQFARDGYRIYVAPLENVSTLPMQDIEILVIDTESRHLSPSEASERVRMAVAATAGTGARTYYKKTDSTLRGNIGAELEALLSASHREAVAYLPSYPDGGRTTEGGELRVNGTPVALTEFARDPLNPVRTSFIPERLAAQTELPTRVEAISAKSPLNPGSIVIYDAIRNSDLEGLAKRLRSERERLVFAGCAGFAAFLNRVIDPPAGLPNAGPSPSSTRRLIVCGSLNPRSLNQLQRAKLLGIPEYSLESLRPLVPNRAKRSRSQQHRVLLDEIRSKVESGGTISVSTDSPGQSREADGLRVARSVGQVVATLVSEIDFDTFIVFGGDTLMAIMREIGVVGVLPIGEVESGVPISIAVQSARSLPHRRPIIVSKAGGFGNDDVLEKIEDYLDKMP
jgi:uncharacterized protein YgbK (DUF1537 family)